MGQGKRSKRKGRRRWGHSGGRSSVVGRLEEKRGLGRGSAAVKRTCGKTSLIALTTAQTAQRLPRTRERGHPGAVAERIVSAIHRGEFLSISAVVGSVSHTGRWLRGCLEW